MPPDPLVLACFACLCALHTMTVHVPASPHQHDDKSGCAPLFKSLDPPLRSLEQTTLRNCQHIKSIFIQNSII